MRLGPKAMEALQKEVPGRLFPGEELIIAGPVAMSGTRELVTHFAPRLSERLSGRFLRDAAALPEIYGKVVPESRLREMAEAAGADFVYEITEGGFLCALWKAAEVSDVGLTVDLRRVPIRQETIEVCECLDVNPYRLLSEKSFLIGIRGADFFVQELRRAGAMVELIGQTNTGRDRLLYSGENPRYLDRPVEDELKRVLGTCKFENA